MIRRYGVPPRNGQRYKLRPGAYAILPRDGRLLVTYQGAPHHEIQLPGGGIDAGESPIQALHREVFEETGWRIGNVRRLGAFRRFAFMPEYDIYAEKLCHIFLALPVRKLGPPSEAGHMAVWLGPHDAVAMVANDGDRAMLAGLLC